MCALLLMLVGCSRSAESTAADEEAIRELLDQYLPRLAETYEDGDVNRLDGLAVPKELAKVTRRIEELAAQGQYLEPALRSLTVENIRVWNYSNAYVSTHEVWDVVLRASGTDEVVGNDLDKPTRVRYQLKRGDEGWRVLYREIQEE